MSPEMVGLLRNYSDACPFCDRDANCLRHGPGRRGGLRLLCFTHSRVKSFAERYFRAICFLPIECHPYVCVDGVGTMDVSSTIIMLLIVAFWCVLGCFIDAMATIVLLVPILMPVITNLGYDLTWFAVIVTALSMIAVVTPPVGVIQQTLLIYRISRVFRVSGIRLDAGDYTR